AGIYNLTWGAAIILFPAALFRFADLDLPRYPQIWQCVGMIVGVYGVGYLIAATDPLRYWLIILVGLLGKIFGPLGFVGALISGDLPLAFGATIITNDLIWWIPFAAILYQVFKATSDRSTSIETDYDTATTTVTSHRGATLAELSEDKPTLVVFLRHTGCTFCRETLAKLVSQRNDLQAAGVSLALVHMSPLMHATQFLSIYRLDDVHRFSDTKCELYNAFGLGRATFPQLFGPKVWLRYVSAALVEGHGIGPLSGDGFRMPGAFLLERGEIVAAFRAESAADSFDFTAIAALAQDGEVHCSIPFSGS
ncbi:MAG: SelL-related redox protein, partial [Planctomycetales bacterium]